MLKVYFAHPINAYSTDLEADLLHLLQMEFGDWEIENPNQAKHQEGYAQWRKDTGNGMRYFTEVVLPECNACVFLAFRDGKVPAGVAKEVQWFLDRDMPVLEVIPLGITYARESLQSERVISIDETRARIRDVDGNTIPY